MIVALLNIVQEENTWPEESAPVAQCPVLKVDTPIHSTLEAIPWLGLHGPSGHKLASIGLASREKRWHLEDSSVRLPQQLRFLLQINHRTSRFYM